MDLLDLEAIKRLKQQGQGRRITPAEDFDITSDYLSTHPGNTTRHEKGGKVKFRKGGMVGKSSGCKTHVDWSK